MRESSNLTRALPRVSMVLAAIALLGVLATASVAAEGDTTRVSVDSSGNQANNRSEFSYISADGRYVAFVSKASNLVPNDTNARPKYAGGDIFVRDLQTGITRRVSVSSSEKQANHISYDSSISAHGRYVAFTSGASNLVPNDTNGTIDVFVRDRLEGTTEIVSLNSSGDQAHQGAGSSSMSADGRYVAFTSLASNLVPNDTNNHSDVFVRDRLKGTTQIVSVDSSGNRVVRGGESPSISTDGRFVSFDSGAPKLVANDTNGHQDIFVHDRRTGTTERVSLNSSERQANSWSMYHSISSDGRFVAFSSPASNLVANDTNADLTGPEDTGTDVFVRDRLEGTTRRVSIDSSGDQANGWSSLPSISPDGRFVVFKSRASNLVANDANGQNDIFVHDLHTGTTQRVGVARGPDFYFVNDFSEAPSISADGRLVAFPSLAKNLVPNDTNDRKDVFVHERDTTP